MDKESLRSMEIRPEPRSSGRERGGVSVNREGFVHENSFFELMWAHLFYWRGGNISPGV